MEGQGSEGRESELRLELAPQEQSTEIPAVNFSKSAPDQPQAATIPETNQLPSTTCS